MPDAAGNIKGIAVPAVPWQEDELETLAKEAQEHDNPKSA